MPLRYMILPNLLLNTKVCKSMLVTFEQLPPTSRIWIYSSKASFTENQNHIVQKELEVFASGWEAHGEGLKASFKIEYGHFIILAVDEKHHSASGCSIDKSVQVIRNIESAAKLDLMDRMTVYVWNDNRIQTHNTAELKELIENRLLTPKTLVFDNSITSIRDYQDKWLKPAGDTWLKRYFRVAYS